MKVVFRADASNDIGIGHVMRCLALADACRQQQAEVSFISRLLPGNVTDLIRQRGYRVYLLQDALPCPPGSQTGLLEQWPEGSQTADANQCIPILQELSADWLIVDHYALDETWHQRVRHCQKHLMVIDDLADRKHDCDLLLDQNWFSTGTASRYDKLVPAKCLKLLGPAYALLKPDFGALRKLLPARDGHVGRVLISMGGGDPSNETLKTLQALMATDLRHLILDVVCGINHHDMPSLQAAAAERGNTNLYRSLPSLAGLMARADLMIGAGGTTTWERMCLGLPAIVISTAQNQYLPNLSLANDGYIFFAGKDSDVSVQNLQDLIRKVIMDKNACQQQSFAGQHLVTGDGVAEVTKTLIHINNNG